MFSRRTIEMITPAQALPGRSISVLLHPHPHTIFDLPVDSLPSGCAEAYFGLGCFWGAEQLFWRLPGVKVTAVGYQGGFTENPTYEEVCSGRTGHTESVRVVFDPQEISYADLLRVFFENHDPTQGNRQGNDVGSQYRSAIYTTTPEQAVVAEQVRAEFQQAFTASGFGPITTELTAAGAFFYAEGYHQQYLDKNPNGYCPIHATGVTCNVPG